MVQTLCGSETWKRATNELAAADADWGYVPLFGPDAETHRQQQARRLRAGEPPQSSELPAFVPRQLFGHEVEVLQAFEPPSAGTCEIAGYRIEALRYDLQNLLLRGLELPDGHVLVLAVHHPDEPSVHLTQGHSVFYTEECMPPPGMTPGEISQGDGASAPRWHKSDRSWPLHPDGSRFTFLGQGYIGDLVLYLFRSEIAEGSGFAIFSDELSRQCTEEHYRLKDF